MKKFVPIAEYSRMTGLSYPTIKNALETGQLKGIKTEAGHWKIDASDTGGDTISAAIMERLDEQQKLLKALCGHLGLGAAIM